MLRIGGDFSSSRATVHLVTHCSIAAAQVLSHRSLELRNAAAMCVQAAPASRPLAAGSTALALRCGHAEIYETAQPSNQAIGA